MISSTDNQVFKSLKRLTTKKGRREAGLCVVEGEKIIFENLEFVVQVFVREGVVVTPNLTDLEPVVLSKKLFDEITELETSPGILATVEIPKPNTTDGSVLVLDRIQDPGNMGTILRTARAFGFNNIITIDSADVWSQKVIRATMGTQFRMSIVDAGYGDLEKLLGDIDVFVADMNGDEPTPSDFPVALVLGNEGQGVSPQILDLAHTKITIPMNAGVESLNVGVAGAILMYELSRRG